MKSKILSLLLAVSALMSAATAMAGTTSATIAPTFNVTGTCQFSQSNYAVAVTGTVGTKPTGTAVVQIKCSPGMTSTITANYVQAYVADGSGNSYAYVEAVAFVDAARTQNLRSNPINIIADGTYHPYTLYLLFQDLYNSTALNRVGTYSVDLPLISNY